MTLSVNSIQEWVQKAQHGQELTYHKGGFKRNERVFEHVRKLAEAGLVFPYQKRVLPATAGTAIEQRFNHVIRRTSPAAHATLDRVSARTNERGQWEG